MPKKQISQQIRKEDRQKMSNATKTAAGVEVYEHKIYELADDYINVLDNPENINNNPSLFTGMIKHIYKYLFKPKRKGDVNVNSNSNIDLNNIDLLDDIWNIYTTLCYKYSKRPTLLNFSLLIGVDNTTLDSWRRGECRGNGQGASSRHSLTVKKWLSECEASLLDGATERNSIGCIFALKANYGYTETPQRIEITGTATPTLTQDEIKQIASQAAETDSAAMLEALPDE